MATVKEARGHGQTILYYYASEKSFDIDSYDRKQLRLKQISRDKIVVIAQILYQQTAIGMVTAYCQYALAEIKFDYQPSYISNILCFTQRELPDLRQNSSAWFRAVLYEPGMITGKPFEAKVTERIYHITTYLAKQIADNEDDGTQEIGQAIRDLSETTIKLTEQINAITGTKLMQPTTSDTSLKKLQEADAQLGIINAFLNTTFAAAQAAAQNMAALTARFNTIQASLRHRLSIFSSIQDILRRILFASSSNAKIQQAAQAHLAETQAQAAQ